MISKMLNIVSVSYIAVLVVGCSSSKPLVSGHGGLKPVVHGWMNQMEANSPYKFKKTTHADVVPCTKRDHISYHWHLSGVGEIYGYNQKQGNKYSIRVGGDQNKQNWTHDVVGHEVCHNHWIGHPDEAKQYGCPLWWGARSEGVYTLFRASESGDDYIHILVKADDLSVRDVSTLQDLSYEDLAGIISQFEATL